MDTSLSFSRLLSSSTTTSLLSPKTKTLSSNFTLPLKLNRFHPKPLRFSTSSKISATISVGDKLPESTFSYLDPAGEVQTITVSDLTKGKKAVLFAVPGAFTPTCSQKHCQLIMCDCSSLIGCFRFVFQKLCARKLILIMGILCGFVSSNWAESVIQFDFEMATQFDMLCDVLPGHNSWKFKVRVLRMWAISSFMKPNELNSMEMVLIDEKGGKIHALIRKELVYLFQNKLKEGEVYKLSNFDVVPVVGFYRTTLHPYKLIFRSNTKVQNFASSDIPILGFSFTDLAEVASYSVNYDYLIDVIGLISGISNEREYIRAGKVIKMVVLELTDNSGKCECALFGDHVDELQRLIGNCPSGLHVVALQFAKVKIFRGKVSIQDVMNTTRIFLDPEIKETSELRKGLAIAGMSNSEKSIEQINAMNEVGVFDVCKENPIVELFELEDVGQSANKVNAIFGTSSPDVAAKEVGDLESYEALNFAEDTLVTPQCEVIDHTIVDCSSVFNVDDDTDDDIHVGMSASKRYRRSFMSNTNDDFVEEISGEIDGNSSVVKVEKD
ncbi:unnamed protein product [Trifolium pratense]|uniref:Uncharacterized protein n=1 Tax=Trifolium pratense TaxID=57577 RepID=A0ACB0J4Z7_TRIPR|nr:unnamed protein product [Trifolium pratense]